MKKYFIKLAALSVAAMLGVCTLAACGGGGEAPADENADVTENVTESTDNKAE